MANNGQSAMIMENPDDTKIDMLASEAKDFLAKHIENMNGNNINGCVKHVVRVKNGFSSLPLVLDSLQIV